MDRFDGTLNELQALVASAGQEGEWLHPADKHHQFRTNSGAVLNWWDTRKKTVSFQGPDAAKRALEVALDLACGNQPSEFLAAPVATAATVVQPASIFVVHGHDEIAREQLERILLLLGLEPFVLMNTSGECLTIIESLEKHIGKAGKCEFGIVLLTPDDMGYAVKDGQDKAAPRARQNVILEMGMLMASLTRAKMAILEKGYVEIPSDADGIIRLKFVHHVKETVPRLVERLRGAGFDIDASKVARAAS